MRKKYNRGFEFLKNASAVTVVLVSMGLAAYIAIAVVFFGNRENSAAVIMLLVVPPAIMGTVLGINAATNDSENRLKRLIDAIEEVASGNYGYQISLENAREFTQLFADFNAMVTELCKTREEIEGFSNAFAHELNTPISSIKGFASLLYETGKETESPQRLEYLRVIADEASRLAGLSGNALLLSKMTAMQIVADKETYNIGEQIRQCVILFDKDIQKKNLKVELAEDFDPLFYGNEDLMRHVWLNLFSNAIKFSPENGKIKIAYSVQGNSARISVKDEGPGISEQDIPHIFERYYQVYSNKGGNGLGLAVAKRAAVLNGADIVPETEEGKGCTFSLVYTLPV